jgi:hypothetical protein
MSKKDEQKIKGEFMDEFQHLTRRIATLSKLAVRQFLGTREPEDPRVIYLVNLEAFKAMTDASLEALLELAIKKMGVTRQEFLQLAKQKLEGQLKTMETDLCVTGWDDAGNPLLDLLGFQEKTKGWPA